MSGAIRTRKAGRSAILHPHRSLAERDREVSTYCGEQCRPHWTSEFRQSRLQHHIETGREVPGRERTSASAAYESDPGVGQPTGHETRRKVYTQPDRGRECAEPTGDISKPHG